ncbi:MAG: sigma-70 family RNA polymerase sigma factor [Planctomycetes bacterium]|nr:sigma-70 family RNA polymerase sigma factor [Planctomycetota bacterium]
MAGTSESRTRATLLGRLRQVPSDQAAWAEFVQRYGPKIYQWCRQWHRQEADVQDVTQNVLLKLVQKMQTFTYDPSRSFRAWLRTLTHHALSDFLASRKRAGLGSGDSQILERLQSVAARDDLVQRLQEEFDLEVLKEAIARVRLRVAPHTWEAFCLTAIEGLSGTEVAQRLHMKAAQVFAARSKVQKMLAEEIQLLEKAGQE